MEQIFHPYTIWEDYLAGMWRKPCKEKEYEWLQKAVKFTGNHELYGAAMLRVLDEWPITCEHNLSNLGQNRKAFIGHAACCLEFGCPEYITRMAWHQLTKEQQILANKEADKAIKIWEDKYNAKSN